MADQGPAPFVTDIERATLDNTMFRDTLWTGEHLQLTVMAIPPGGEIGLEMHHDTDQFLRVEAGRGRVMMGKASNDLQFQEVVSDDDIVMVPAGSWHNVVNIGDTVLKVYSLYGPPDHVHGTRHATTQDADADPNEQH